MAYQSWSVVFEEQPSVAKWNILGSNDASFNDGTGIGASAITPEKLLSGTGTSWPWTSFTPSYTGITVGSGTNTGYYKQIGKTVFFQTRFVYGSGSSLGANVYLTPPVTVSPNYSTTTTATPIGQAIYLDTGSANYFGYVQVTGSGFQLCSIVVNATYAVANGISSTNPFTFASTDEIRLSGVYEAA